MDENRETAPAARAHALSNDGQWLLRAFNGWVWAREAKNPTPERTWVVPVELPDDLDVAKKPNTGSSPEQGVPDAEELALWFSLAREECPLWRAVWFYDGRSSERTYTLFFGPDGDGVLREAWNRDDIEFNWTWPGGNTQSAVRDGDFGEFRVLAKTVFFEQLWEKLSDWSEDKDRARRTYLNIEPQFLSGSEDELKRLLRLFACTDPVLSASRAPIEFDLVPESAYARASLRGVSATGVSSWHGRDWDEHPDDDDHVHLKWRGTLWPGLARMQELVELALDENTPCGMWWEYSDNFAGRVSHTPDASTLDFKFDAPTQHERIEARLQLREWLGSRVSEEDLKRLIGE